MLEGPVQEKGVPLRMTARTVSGEGTRCACWSPLKSASRPISGALSRRAHRDRRRGSVKARTAATTVLAPARAGRQSPSLFTTSLLLDPG